jgi:predicted PurR-regulated permease PerM
MIAMALERQVAFWLAVLAVLIAALWLFGEILLPFVAGMALAYLLNPLTNRLERLGISRALAALLILGVVVLVFVVLVLLVMPVVLQQLGALIDNIPGNVRRIHQYLTDPSRPWLSKLVGSSLTSGDTPVGDFLSQGVGWLTGFLKSLWSGGRALISIFSLVVVTPVVAFYLICDWPRMIATVDSWIPLQSRDTVRSLAHEIDTVMSGFIRGQSAVCLLLGAFYALSLSLVGLNFGLLIGLIAGAISFIPYVGSLTGLVLAIAVALAQFWPEWTWVLVVLAIFLVGQFIEGNVLSPKLVGASVGLHPLWLMFALFAFGYLFGFVGLLLAVPLAAAAGVLARFALRQYLASPLYTGGEPR